MAVGAIEMLFGFLRLTTLTGTAGGVFVFRVDFRTEGGVGLDFFWLRDSSDGISLYIKCVYFRRVESVSKLSKLYKSSCSFMQSLRKSCYKCSYIESPYALLLDFNTVIIS